MSSEKLLNEMPVVLSAVMDHLDFRSIFIDKVVPSSSKTKILLTVRPYDVELILEDSETEVRYDKEENIDKEVCEKAHPEFLNQLHNNLVGRKYPLKVANMRFLIRHQHEIMSILPYMNSEKLERISIFHAQELERPMLKLDKVVEIEQWKSAKHPTTHSKKNSQSLSKNTSLVSISDCYTVEPIEKFAHFEECEITVNTISLEFFRHLIEILLNHQSLKSFTLQYESRYESEELKCWFEILFDGIIGERTWYKRIPGTEDNFLVMIPHYASEFTFSRIKLKRRINVVV